MEEKSELPEQEQRNIVGLNYQMLKSTASEVLAERFDNGAIDCHVYGMLNRTNFISAMKTALDFKLKVGDRVMTEDEVYRYANELVDERIQRFSSI